MPLWREELQKVPKLISLDGLVPAGRLYEKFEWDRALQKKEKLVEFIVAFLYVPRTSSKSWTVDNNND